MILINKILSRALDTYLLFNQNDKTCQLIRKPDTFNGKVYSIDELFDITKQYFEKPWEFYNDHQEVDINLRRGKPTEFYWSYKSIRKHQAYIFDTPLPSKWRNNNIVPFKWFTNSIKKSDTILLFAPGGWRSNYRVEERFCYSLFEKGIDAGLMTVPYQIERMPEESNYSGEYFISSHIYFTIENFQQFVSEIRRLIQHMRKIYKYVGLIGMSSGGFYTAIAANCEEVDFFFPFITGCKLGSITFKGSLTRFLVKDLIKQGIDEDGLNKAWSISDQLVLGNHLKAKHVKHYISLFDKTVPTEFQFLLWQKYGKRDKLELETGHESSYLKFEVIVNDIVSFIKERIDLKEDSKLDLLMEKHGVL